MRGNWHCLRPFTQYSYVLYEFLCHNNFGVANFAFNQNNNYTYFKGKNTSYIDHCVISSHFMDNVKNCEILSDLPDNCNDHFPIVTWCNIDVKKQENNGKSVPKVNPPSYINWKDEQVQCKYREVLSEMLPHFKVPVANNGAQQHVDIYHDSIVNIMHKAAESAVTCVIQLC